MAEEILDFEKMDILEILNHPNFDSLKIAKANPPYFNDDYWEIYFSATERDKESGWWKFNGSRSPLEKFLYHKIKK